MGESEAVQISSPSIVVETVLALVCASVCTGQCCVSDEILFSLSISQHCWHWPQKENFPATVVQTISLADCLYDPEKSIFPLYFQYATKHKLSKMGEKALLEVGFANWKKALKKFKSHDESQYHREATLKWAARWRPTIAGQLNMQKDQMEKDWRQGLWHSWQGYNFLPVKDLQSEVTLNWKEICHSYCRAEMMKWSNDGSKKTVSPLMMQILNKFVADSAAHPFRPDERSWSCMVFNHCRWSHRCCQQWTAQLVHPLG